MTAGESLRSRSLRALVLADLSSAETRNWGLTLAGYAIRFALTFAASVIVARWLGPAGYGLVALVAVVVALAHTAGDLGVTYAAIRAMSRSLESGWEGARALAQAHLFLTVLGSAAVAAIGLVLAEPVARLLLGRPEAESYLRLGLLGLLPMAGGAFIAAVLQSMSRFRQLAIHQVVVAAAYLAGVAALAATERLSVGSVVLLGAATPLVGFVVGLWLLPHGWVSCRKVLKLPERDARSELIGFGRWMWVSSMLAVLGSQVDLVILAHWVSETGVGVYALALSLAIKLDVLNQTRSTVLLPAVSSLRTRAELGAYLRRNLARSLVLCLPLALAVPLAGPFILTFYGSAYAESVPLFQALLVVVMFDLLTRPLLLVAFPLNAPKVVAGSDLTRVVTLALAAAVLIPGFGLIGAAAAKLASRVMGAAFAFALLWRLARSRDWAASGEQTAGYRAQVEKQP